MPIACKNDHLRGYLKNMLDYRDAKDFYWNFGTDLNYERIRGKFRLWLKDSHNNILFLKNIYGSHLL